MTEFEDSSAGDIADAFRRFEVDGIVVGILAEPFHERLVNGFRVGGEQVRQCTISGIADRFFFVAEYAFVRGTAKRTAQLGCRRLCHRRRLTRLTCRCE
jgi:hypothetical protein